MSDEIDRMARAMYATSWRHVNPDADAKWPDLPGIIKDRWRDIAKAGLAALKGGEEGGEAPAHETELRDFIEAWDS